MIINGNIWLGGSLRNQLTMFLFSVLRETFTGGWKYVTRNHYRRIYSWINNRLNVVFLFLTFWSDIIYAIHVCPNTYTKKKIYKPQLWMLIEVKKNCRLQMKMLHFLCALCVLAIATNQVRGTTWQARRNTSDTTGIQFILTTERSPSPPTPTSKNRTNQTLLTTEFFPKYQSLQGGVVGPSWEIHDFAWDTLIGEGRGVEEGWGSCSGEEGNGPMLLQGIRGSIPQLMIYVTEYVLREPK